MPSRIWGDTKAYFFELDQIPSGSPFSYGGANHLMTVVDNTPEWRRLMSAIGSGRATFYATGNWEQFIVPGRVCVIHKYVTGYSGIVMRVLTCFLIEDIEPMTDANGISVINVSGPGVESLLSKRPVWKPVGEETVIEVELLNTAAGPASTTLDAGSPPGNDSIIAVSTTNIDVDDEIRIRMGVANDGDWHIARVTAVNPAGAPAGSVQFMPDLPAIAETGNSVETRTAGLSLTSAANMAPGQRVDITLDSAAVFSTTIASVRGPINAIYLEEGLPSVASAGNAVVVYDYSDRTNSDVTQVMQYAPEWTVVFESGNGSAVGTAHVPKGDSVYDLLSTIAERTGEFFRYRILVTGLPTYRLDWRRTADDSGVRLIMYDTDEYARQATDELDIGKAAAFNLKRKWSRPLITRVYPRAGNGEISLRYCSETALADAYADGFTVQISEDLYEPDYVELFADVEDFGVWAIPESYGDIAADDAGTAAGLTAAADQLLLSAMQTLHQAHLRIYYTVEAYVPALIHPGQYVRIENETGTQPAADWLNTYVVLETTERMVNGRPRTTLIVSNQSGLRRTAAVNAATAIRSVIQTQRRTRSGGAAGGATKSIVVGGGSGGSDHGGLTGLTDDDHPQYLKTDGSRTLTGNLAVASGVTIDGVDISALAAAGSHPPAVAGNYGIRVVDPNQIIDLKLSALTPGLAIRQVAPNEGLTILLNQTASGLELSASGLALADAIAGDGIKIASKILAIDPATNSGLLITGGQLALGTPGGLTAITTNAVSGSGHTHAVSASANPGAATQLLKTDASGYLQLLALAIGTTPGAPAGLKLTSPVSTWHALMLKQRVDQSAPILRVESSTGSALILLTQTGDLESGTPGFVSGLTGWQIQADGDAEFNNVRIRGELHAATFVADEMHATGGTFAVMTATTIAKPTAAFPNTMGAIDGIGTSKINVTASWDTALCYFSVGDVIRMKTMGEVVSGASLDLYDVYLDVRSVSSIAGRDLANGNPGYYSLQCTRKSGAYSGWKVPTGTAAVKWTKSSSVLPSTAITGGMYLTSDLSQSPYLDIFTVDASLLWSTPWPGSGETRTPPTIKPRVRVGNLDGVLGLPEQWGIAAGTDLSDTSTAAKYLVASNLGLTLNNVDLSMYAAGVRVARLSPSGLVIGNSEDDFVFERTIRWERPSGALVGAIAARGDGSYARFELGADPVFGADLMVENGLSISHDKTLPYGNFQHYAKLMSWGTVDLDAGHSIRLSGPYVGVSGGLAVGITSSAAEQGVVRMKERTAAIGTPPTGTAGLYILKRDGRQELYIKFEDGSGFTVAQSTS